MHVDSGFNPDRSDGCRFLMMNGAVTSSTANQHPTFDDSSTLAEITECKYAADDVVAFWKFLGELGFELEQPSIIYQDNRPAIMIVNSEKSLGSKSRHMMIRCAKLSEQPHRWSGSDAQVKEHSSADCGSGNEVPWQRTLWISQRFNERICTSQSQSCLLSRSEWLLTTKKIGGN